MHFLGKQQRCRSAFFLNAIQNIMLTLKGGKWAARWLMALLKKIAFHIALWKSLVMALSQHNVCTLDVHRRKQILSRRYQG